MPLLVGSDDDASSSDTDTDSEADDNSNLGENCNMGDFFAAAFNSLNNAENIGASVEGTIPPTSTQLLMEDVDFLSDGLFGALRQSPSSDKTRSGPQQMVSPRFNGEPTCCCTHVTDPPPRKFLNGHDVTAALKAKETERVVETLDGMFDFYNHFFNMLEEVHGGQCTALLHRIQQRLGEWTMNTAYTGVHAPGVSANGLAVTLANRLHSDQPQYIRHETACEIDAMTMDELTRHPNKPKHLFRDNRLFLSQHLRDELDQLMACNISISMDDLAQVVTKEPNSITPYQYCYECQK
eukprot:8727478-Karenia_brevis.AAC.1